MLFVLLPLVELCGSTQAVAQPPPSAGGPAREGGASVRHAALVGAEVLAGQTSPALSACAGVQQPVCHWRYHPCTPTVHVAAVHVAAVHEAAVHGGSFLLLCSVASRKEATAQLSSSGEWCAVPCVLGVGSDFDMLLCIRPRHQLGLRLARLGRQEDMEQVSRPCRTDDSLCCIRAGYV